MFLKYFDLKFLLLLSLKKLVLLFHEVLPFSHFQFQLISVFILVRVLRISNKCRKAKIT